MEHNEASVVASVREAAANVRYVAAAIADEWKRDLLSAYIQRLSAIQANHVIAGPSAPHSELVLSTTSTLRDVQVAQAEHDRYYHPDVFGMPKVEQLRHYTLHVAKLTGLLAEAIESDHARCDFVERRLPDLLLFGVKIATVVNERLPDDRPAEEALRQT